MDWNVYIVTVDFGGGVVRQYESPGITAAGAHVLLVETYEYQMDVMKRGNPKRVGIEIAAGYVTVEAEEAK